jgi:hypothetical protein
MTPNYFNDGNISLFCSLSQVTLKRDKDCARRVTMLFNEQDIQVSLDTLRVTCFDEE